MNGDPIPRSTLEQMAADAVSRLVGRKVTVDELKHSGARMGVDIDGLDIDISFEDIRDRSQDFFSRAYSRVRSAARPADPDARAEARARREQTRHQNAQARERASQVSKARRILGYSAKEPLTTDQVKQRHRELARKHHPDRGGSLERMQDINWAVDILLKPG